jgi:hypothetical protein
MSVHIFIKGVNKLKQKTFEREMVQFLSRKYMKNKRSIELTRMWAHIISRSFVNTLFE